MTRLVVPLVLLVLGLLAQCGADETESLNMTLGDAGEETEDTVLDDLVLEDNTEVLEDNTEVVLEEPGEGGGEGGDFVDPSDFVGSEVTERQL